MKLTCEVTGNKKMKTTPWNKIKAEYLAGATPKELALKYKISAKSISDKFSKGGVVEEKRKISKEIEEQIKEKTILSAEEVLELITKIATNEQEKTSNRLKAAELLGKRHKVFSDGISINGIIDLKTTVVKFL